MGRNWCGNLCRKKKLEAFVYRELHVNCYWEKAAQPTSTVAQAAVGRGRKLATEASRAPVTRTAGPSVWDTLVPFSGLYF